MDARSIRRTRQRAALALLAVRQTGATLYEFSLTQRVNTREDEPLFAGTCFHLGVSPNEADGFLSVLTPDYLRGTVYCHQVSAANLYPSMRVLE